MSLISVYGLCIIHTNRYYKAKMYFYGGGRCEFFFKPSVEIRPHAFHWFNSHGAEKNSLSREWETVSEERSGRRRYASGGFVNSTVTLYR